MNVKKLRLAMAVSLAFVSVAAFSCTTSGTTLYQKAEVPNKTTSICNSGVCAAVYYCYNGIWYPADSDTSLPGAPNTTCYYTGADSVGGCAPSDYVYTS